MLEDDPRNLAAPHAMGMCTVHVPPDPVDSDRIHHHTDDLAGFLHALKQQKTCDKQCLQISFGPHTSLRMVCNRRRRWPQSTRRPASGFAVIFVQYSSFWLGRLGCI